MAAEKPGSDPLSAFYAKYRDWYPHIDKTFGVWAANRVMLDE